VRPDNRFDDAKVEQTGDIAMHDAQGFAIRDCAEYARPAQLNVVELDFEVTPDGHATAIGQAQSGLEQCLDQSLTSVTFPAAASAAAQVHYPLYFVPAEAKPNRARRGLRGSKRATAAGRAAFLATRVAANCSVRVGA